MIILSIRTDKPEAELALYNDTTQLAQIIWQAHRELAETLHIKVDELLRSQNKQLRDVEAIAIYKGPGSFTGLRIGLSVANALAYSLDIPMVGEAGELWREAALQRLAHGETDRAVLPEYGGEVHITAPRK